MKAFPKTMLLTAMVALSASTAQKFYRLTPGEHVGPFHIGKSTADEVRAMLGEGELSDFRWLPFHSSSIATYTTLSYPDKGLRFYFYSLAESQKNRFGKIEITRGLLAMKVYLCVLRVRKSGKYTGHASLGAIQSNGCLFRKKASPLNLKAAMWPDLLTRLFQYPSISPE